MKCRAGENEQSFDSKIHQFGINSPFEEFAISLALNQLGIPSVYVRAIYMTGSKKIEASTDLRKYESHKNILDTEGNPILQETHNYITIRAGTTALTSGSPSTATHYTHR